FGPSPSANKVSVLLGASEIRRSGTAAIVTLRPATSVIVTPLAAGVGVSVGAIVGGAIVGGAAVGASVGAAVVGGVDAAALAGAWVGRAALAPQALRISARNRVSAVMLRRKNIFVSLSELQSAFLTIDDRRKTIQSRLSSIVQHPANPNQVGVTRLGGLEGRALQRTLSFSAHLWRLCRHRWAEKEGSRGPQAPAPPLKRQPCKSYHDVRKPVHHCLSQHKKPDLRISKIGRVSRAISNAP